MRQVCCPGLDPTTPPRPNSPQQNFGSGNAGKPPPERPPPPPPTPTGTAASGGPGRPANVANEPNLRLLPHDVCGPISSFRIINGKKTVVFEFPWMARLGYKSIREQDPISFVSTADAVDSVLLLSPCTLALAPLPPSPALTLTQRPVAFLFSRGEFGHENIWRE